MVEIDEFSKILLKSGVMDIGGKKRAQRRNLVHNRHPAKLSRGANLIIEQLACKDKPEDNKEAYRAKMREFRARRRRG